MIDRYGRTTDNEAVVGNTQVARDDKWFNDILERTYRKRLRQGLACATDESQSPEAVSGQSPIVREDDVCIHVIGLPANLTQETAFAGIYGVTKQPQAWQIPNTDFELFVADSEFYHRDQRVPIKGPLKDLGVNYHGELQLTADRTEIVQNHVLYSRYEMKLRNALDIAMHQLPELAVRIMSSFLSDRYGFYAPRPTCTSHANQYRTAFEAVCRARRPDLFESGKRVFPYSRRRFSEDEPIMKEMNLVPWPLEDWQLDVLEAAGAYISPAKFSEHVFLRSRKMALEELAGLGLFQKCLSQILPESLQGVSVLDYPHSQPRCVVRNGRVFLAGPKPCIKCRSEHCYCWIGPALVRVARCFMGRREPDLERIFEIFDKERGIRLIRKPTVSVTSGVEIVNELSHAERDEEFSRDVSRDVSDIKTEDENNHHMDLDSHGLPDNVCDHFASQICARGQFLETIVRG